MEQSDLTVLQIHPLAEQFFPMMEEEELHALVESIQANGQRDPITLFDGRILDGRNRFAACTRLGIAPQTASFQGSERDAAAFVMDKNRHRRHLNAAQKAMAEAAYAEFYKEQGMQRMREGGKQGGKVSRKSRAQDKGTAVTAVPLSDKDSVGEEPREWVADAAKKAGVSPTYIYTAQRVLRSGDEEVIAQVKHGKISLEKAEKMLKAKQTMEASPPPTAAPALPSTPAARRKKRPPRRRSPEPYTFPPQKPDLALTQLQYWWDLATPEQRNTFAEWTHTHEEARQRTHPLIFVSPRLSLAGSAGSAPVDSGTNGTSGESGNQDDAEISRHSLNPRTG